MYAVLRTNKVTLANSYYRMYVLAVYDSMAAYMHNVAVDHEVLRVCRRTNN